MSGVVSSIVELAVTLTDHGHRVALLVPFGGNAINQPAMATLRSRGIDVQIAEGRGLFAATLAAKRLVERNRPDVVHFHNGFSVFNNLLALSLALGRSAPPYVVTTHGVYAPEGLRRGRLKKAIAARLMDRSFLRAAAAVTALTPAEVGEVLAICARATVVELPLGFASPAPVDAALFRTELGLDAEALLAVYVGRFDIDHKRLDDLVRGVAATTRWHLALVGGDGRPPPELVDVIDATGIGDRVHLVGPRYGAAFEQVSAAGDVAALLSKSEGLPRGLVQAFGHRVPGVVSAEVAQRLAVMGIAGAAPWWVTTPDGLSDTLAEIEALTMTERRQVSDAAARWAAQLDWAGLGARWSALMAEVAR